MELDCAMYEHCTLVEVNESSLYPIKLTCDGVILLLSKYGGYSQTELAKCVIFPKGKSSWEGFVPPFKDGDVVATLSGSLIGITEGGNYNCFIPIYCAVDVNNEFITSLENKEVWIFNRLATKAERQKLFDAIKANGYKWVEEKKCLEKLIEPKFKVGDRIQYNGSNYKPIHIIKSIVADRYIFDNDDYIKFGDEVHYSLLKFDISTLKPYKSEVLYRNTVNGYWKPAFWGAYIPEKSERHQYHDFLTTAGFAHYCIPYEGNEHLMGKQDDCSDYYKTWEE